MMYDPAAVIKISDDSSTDSDMGLDSDFNSSPESVFETDDVIFVEHTYNGFTAEDRSKQSSSMGLAPSFFPYQDKEAQREFTQPQQHLLQVTLSLPARQTVPPEALWDNSFSPR